MLRCLYMQESDGCLKAFLMSLGLLVSLVMLGFVFLYVLGAGMGGGKVDDSYGVWLLLLIAAVLIFGVWAVVALIRVTQVRRRNLRMTPKSGDSPSPDL